MMQISRGESCISTVRSEWYNAQGLLNSYFRELSRIIHRAQIQPRPILFTSAEHGGSSLPTC